MVEEKIGHENNDNENEDIVKLLLDEIQYLKEDNKIKSHIIKNLTENHHENIKENLNKDLSLKKSTIRTDSTQEKQNLITEIPSSSKSVDQLPKRKSSKDKETKTPITKSKKKQNRNKKVTVIIGDSMVRDIGGWDLSNEKQHVVVKAFRGANTDNMKWHSKPTSEQKPQNVILHCGARNIQEGVKPINIANDIIAMAKLIKKESGSDITISAIVPRRSKLNNKVESVNEILEEQCTNLNMGVVRHDNNNSKYHCTHSGLPLVVKMY